MDNLPVVTVVIEPENVDLSRYVKIGEEHTRTLEMKPGYLYVKDTVRPTYALKNEMEAVDNGEKAVITAPMPLMPIYKGMPGASMLAEVLLQKYEYHVPFYRQVKQLEHLGVKLSKTHWTAGSDRSASFSGHFIWNSGRKYWPQITSRLTRPRFRL